MTKTTLQNPEGCRGQDGVTELAGTRYHQAQAGPVVTSPCCASPGGPRGWAGAEGEDGVAVRVHRRALITKYRAEIRAHHTHKQRASSHWSSRPT